MRARASSKSCVGGKGNRVRVMYCGERLTTSEIAMRECLSTDQVYRRWRNMGAPEELKPSDFDGAREFAAKQELEPIKFHFEGKRYTASELARLFNVSAKALYNRRRRRGQNVFTRAELEAMRMRPFGAGATDAAGSRLVEKPKPSIPRNIHDVEYNPSSMERSILAMM